MDLFFIGWYLLSIITCGILLFYVLPYHLVSQMNLFLTIKEEKGFPTIYPEEKTKPLPTTEWMDENNGKLNHVEFWVNKKSAERTAPYEMAQA